MALVVDDLELSFESTAYVHTALKKFVDEQTLPGDLVAILRTGGGIGTLQQFTSDKRLLYAAIDRVKFNAQGRVGISSFEPLLTLNTPGGPGSVTPIAAVGGTGMGNAEAARDIDVTYLAGSLGAIRYVVQGLKELPGRKSLILFSENMPMSSHPDVIDSLHRLTDAAERASVVIYAIDARGLAVLELTAADQTAGLPPAHLTSAALRRTQDYLASQDGMSFLARETGGLFIHDLNDIPGSVRQVLEDSSGYYLIGYRPAARTFDPVTGRRKFHHVRVRVKRTGLFVRTRGGFFGLSDRETAPVLTTRESQISHALASPFSAPDIQLRLTAIFSNQSKGSFVTTFLHTDARDIAFTHDADGSYKGTVDLIAALFGDNGQVVASGDFTYALRVKDEDYDSVLKNGFIFREQHLIKQPGAYQIRLVMRDATTQKIRIGEPISRNAGRKERSFGGLWHPAEPVVGFGCFDRCACQQSNTSIRCKGKCGGPYLQARSEDRLCLWGIEHPAPARQSAAGTRASSALSRWPAILCKLRHAAGFPRPDRPSSSDRWRPHSPRSPVRARRLRYASNRHRQTGYERKISLCLSMDEFRSGVVGFGRRASTAWLSAVEAECRRVKYCHSDDPHPFRRQVRLSQQAAQSADGRQHRFLSPPALPHALRLEQLLYRKGSP